RGALSVDDRPRRLVALRRAGTRARPAHPRDRARFRRRTRARRPRGRHARGDRGAAQATGAEDTAMSTTVCPHCGAVNRIREDREDKPACGACKRELFDGPIELDAASFDAHVSKSGIPVLVDFWAEWCGPCKMMAPLFAQAASMLEPTARLAKVDIDA